MSQIITATYQNGVFKPDQPLSLSEGTRVQLVLTSDGDASEQTDDEAWEELERLWAKLQIDSGGRLLTRDELHERR